MEQSVDAWIDSNHLMRKVTAQRRFVFMTDGAIGRREEPNLRHVTINLGSEADRSRIIPILTTKHSLEYCLEFAERSYSLGFRSLVVLGGDKTDNFPAASNMLTSFAGLPSASGSSRLDSGRLGKARMAVGAKSNTLSIRTTSCGFLSWRKFRPTTERRA